MNTLLQKMQRELNGLPFIGANFRLDPINGGAVNCSYYLESGCERFFVKTFESDEIALLDRATLFDIQNQLLTKQLAVKPVYISTENHFQIDQWEDTATLDQARLSSVKVTQRLASALSKIHASNINAPKLDLPKQWQHYLQLLGIPDGIGLRDKLKHYANIWEQACAEYSVFCHNDLALSHVTLSKPVKIFDWEYCAMSSPYFDIASCIAVNGLGQPDEASLCTYYAQFTGARLSEVIDKVAIMKPLVEFTNGLWYRAAKTTI